MPYASRSVFAYLRTRPVSEEPWSEDVWSAAGEQPGVPATTTTTVVLRQRPGMWTSERESALVLCGIVYRSRKVISFQVLVLTSRFSFLSSLQNAVGGRLLPVPSPSLANAQCTLFVFLGPRVAYRIPDPGLCRSAEELGRGVAARREKESRYFNSRAVLRS